MLNMYMYVNVIIIFKPYYFYSNNIKTHKKMLAHQFMLMNNLVNHMLIVTTTH